jgi:hypothetical protein
MFARRSSAVLPVAAALLAAGCGAQAGSGDVASKSFPEPERQAVSPAVRDLSDAAGQRDYEQICSDFLAAPLVKQLDAAKRTARCPDQIELSLRDVGDTGLAVRDVRISGSDAVAIVAPAGTGGAERPARYTLVKEGTRWKLSGVE